MRPQILYPLFSDVESLPGIGPAMAKAFARIYIHKVMDLLWHLPIGAIDRRFMPRLDEVKEGDVITAAITIDQHIVPPKYMKGGGKVPYRVLCHNDSGFLQLVFFGSHNDYLAKQLPIGSKKIISGKAEIFSGRLQVSHPDFVVAENELEKIPPLQPIYGLTEGVSQKKMAAVIGLALNKIPELPEWLAEDFMEKNKFPNFKSALLKLQKPEKIEDLNPDSPHRKRLAFDEFLASQIKLSLARKKIGAPVAEKIKGNSELGHRLLANLSFKLTKGQERVIEEIVADLGKGRRMLRLLQGDVGSGKTIVALLAMLDAIAAGKQAALMAPTEILARQHFNWITKVTEDLDIEIALITSKAKDKKANLEEIASGGIQLVIGTHALLEGNVTFKNLALAVVDEQHRFGVEQRVRLAEKGNNIHILLMTATPIPRTLTMTYYGDMDISVLPEKPAGRQEIDTRIISASRIGEVLMALKRAIEQGNKAYWICPLIEESEKSDLAAVESRFADFKKIYGAEKVALIHGRMKQDQKEKAMAEFAYGDKAVLVATTVIEVGVDVPDASIIVIEHAERFGLAQLHQMRGRVGRGEKKSTCLLLYAEPLSEVGKRRLQVMRQSNDGFFIAEEDLKLRGSGEILGTRQSGLPEFKIADLAFHQPLLIEAREMAEKMLREGAVNKPEIGILTEIFEYEEDKTYLKAG